VQHVGVSNYSPYKLEALPGTTPAVNQCEMSVEDADSFATVAYCAATGIRYQSYGAVRGCSFGAPAVVAAAAAHGLCLAQVRIRSLYVDLVKTGLLNLPD
jgi:diketogulonate reductase-like aldo/keto reductase